MRLPRHTGLIHRNKRYRRVGETHTVDYGPLTLSQQRQDFPILPGYSISDHIIGG